ncbi:MAG: hypothetical protein AABX51_07410, partial [Nanoarchaeota archaeon]
MKRSRKYLAITGFASVFSLITVSYAVDKEPRLFQLNNVKPKFMLDLIERQFPGAAPVVDARLNAIQIYDIPENIGKISKIIEINDVAGRMVGISTKIYEINTSNLTKIGINPDNSYIIFNQITPQAIKAMTIGSYPTVMPGKFDLTYEKGDASILANTTITCESGDPVKIASVDKVPIPETTTQQGVTVTTIRYEEVGITMDIVATIYNNDEIGLNITGVVSSVSSTS